MSQSSLIDSIVAGVLKQLGQEDAAPNGSRNAAVEKDQRTMEVVRIDAKVVTAEMLESLTEPGTALSITNKAIVTPAAWDYIREHEIEVRRNDAEVGGKTASRNVALSPQPSALGPLLTVVHNTEAAERLWSDLKTTWRREMLGCPDDAAKLAIGELCRGGASTIVILAQQTYRAACLANRHEKAKAVPVDSAADVKSALKQLRVNTWCIDPTGKSWFELKSLFKSISPGH